MVCRLHRRVAWAYGWPCLLSYLTTTHSRSRAWATRRSSSLRLQRHQVLFGVVLSPRFFVGGSLALVSFSMPHGVCLEPRHFSAPVLPVSGIRNRGRSNEIGWFHVPAAGFLSAGVAEALACGFFVKFFSERGPCDRLSNCRCPRGQEQLWFVRTATGPDGYRCLDGLPFPHHFLLMARALSRQPHLTAANTGFAFPQSPCFPTFFPHSLHQE